MKCAALIIILLLVSSTISFAQHWTNYTLSNSHLPDNKVNSVCVDDFGHVWCGTDNGLARFDGAEWKVYQSNDDREKIAGNSVSAVMYDFYSSMHEMWIGTNNGVSVIEFDRDPDAVAYAALYQMINDDVSLPSNIITAISIDERHARWFGTDAGIACFYGSQWHTYTSEEHYDLSSDTITSAFSKNDTTYFATIGGGVSRLVYDLDATTTASPLDQWGFIASNNVYSVFVDSRGAKWCGTDKGVSRFENKDMRLRGNWVTYTTDTVFTSTLINGIPYDSIYVVENGALIDDMVTAIAEDKDGVLWFGTPKGATSFDGETWLSFSTHDGLVDNHINSIAADSNSGVWFATDGGVSKFDAYTSAVNFEQRTSQPRSFDVANYPNPFNMHTTIEFDVPDDRIVTIKIVDVAGRDVVQLMNQNLSAGRHGIKWDGRNNSGDYVVSGVYFVIIRAEDQSAIHKVIALK